MEFEKSTNLVKKSNIKHQEEKESEGSPEITRYSIKKTIRTWLRDGVPSGDLLLFLAEIERTHVERVSITYYISDKEESKEKGERHYQVAHDTIRPIGFNKKEFKGITDRE